MSWCECCGEEKTFYTSGNLVLIHRPVCSPVKILDEPGYMRKRQSVIILQEQRGARVVTNIYKCYQSHKKNITQSNRPSIAKY
jgi:hypothetical protein